MSQVDCRRCALRVVPQPRQGLTLLAVLQDLLRGQPLLADPAQLELGLVAPPAQHRKFKMSLCSSKMVWRAKLQL